MLNKIVCILFFIVGTFSLFSKESEPEIKVTAEIQKSGFVGEAMEYKVTLWSTSENISNVGIAQSPEFPAGVEVVQGVVRNTKPQQLKKNGKTYFCHTIVKSFIIPSISGKISVKGGKFIVYIPKIKEINNGFWGMRRVIDYEEKLVECNNVTFNVSELPSSKTSKDFSGCVGDFKIEGWFPPGKIYRDREAVVVFTISGFGALGKIRIPNISHLFASGCRLKEVEQDNASMQRDGKLFTEVTLTCKFVPTDENFIIDPLCMDFFNPSVKKYYNLCSDTLHWTGGQSERRDPKTNRQAVEI